MTVPTTLSNTTFTGIVDGVALDCLFPVENIAHLEVTYGADVVAVIGVDYTVALFAPAYDHATVTPVVGFAVKSGGTINVARKVPIVQSLTIPTLAEIASARLEQAFDYLTFIATDLRDRLTFSLKYPTTDDPTMNLAPLPSAADRAGKLLGFDGAGRPSAVTISTTGAQAFSAFGSTWALVASAANAMTSLGFSAYMAGLKATATLDALQTALGMSAFFKTLLPAVDAPAARATLGVYSTTQVDALFPRGHLAGLGGSTVGGSATLTVAVGVAADSTNAAMLKLAGALAKTTAGWAAGTATGGLDTGAIADNTTYHWYLITKADGSGADIIFSTNATLPTLPATYTLYRRIFSWMTVGAGKWASVIQTGDRFDWRVPVTDVNGATAVAAASITLSVPIGIAVIALANWYLAIGATGCYVLLTSLDQTDTAPSITIFSFGTGGNANNVVTGGTHSTRTDTNGQIRIRSTHAADTVANTTLGWIDRRGRDS